MIPQLGPATSHPAGIACSPPLRFRPLFNVTHATMRVRDYVRAKGMTEAQEAGLRYEAKAQAHLLDLIPDYLSGVVLSFLDGGVARTLIPDGLLIYPDRAFIFEIKHQHCPEAWWQLEKLYKQVLVSIIQRPVSLVEVCRTFDPSTLFPVPVAHVPDLKTWVSKPQDHFGVYTWR